MWKELLWESTILNDAVGKALDSNDGFATWSDMLTIQHALACRSSYRKPIDTLESSCESWLLTETCTTFTVTKPARRNMSATPRQQCWFKAKGGHGPRGQQPTKACTGLKSKIYSVTTCINLNQWSEYKPGQMQKVAMLHGPGNKVEMLEIVVAKE